VHGIRFVNKQSRSGTGCLAVYPYGNSGRQRVNGPISLLSDCLPFIKRLMVPKLVLFMTENSMRH